MQLCFFEDQQCSQFQPLTLTRPVDDLRIGILTIRSKWEQSLNANSVSRVLREPLHSVFPGDPVDTQKPCVFINARYFPESSLLNKVTKLDEGSCLQSGSTVIAAKVDGKTGQKWLQENRPRFNSLFVVETGDFNCITKLWDLFQFNGRQIREDIALMKTDDIQNESISEHARLENPEDIHIEKGAHVEAGCVLNAREGPIYIGRDATVMSGSLIRGPVAVCEGATVKMGAKIYRDTTIGPVSKVGGEVNNCIFHSYSNKGHDGFVGNSVFGQWCNLGADTNTSNLKNNYSPIRITDWQTQDEVETGQQFFGTVMGDHSKTAINTQLNTGTICGVSCNIFSDDFPPTFIPSYSWVGSNVIQPFKLDKAFEMIEAMMARRDVELTDAYRQMMKELFKQSRH